MDRLWISSRSPWELDPKHPLLSGCTGAVGLLLGEDAVVEMGFPSAPASLLHGFLAFSFYTLPGCPRSKPQSWIPAIFIRPQYFAGVMCLQVETRCSHRSTFTSESLAAAGV